MLENPAVSVTLAIAALALGPVLAAVSQKRPGLHAALDGFVIATVGGLCLFHLLPHAFETLAAWAIPVAVGGFVLPWIFERGLHRHTESRFLLLIALAGLIVHAAIDGAALGVGGHAAAELGSHGDHLHGPGTSQSHGALALTLAIVVHRLPVGLLIWVTVRPALGRAAALILLGLLGVFTVVGAAMSRPVLDLMEGHLVVGVLEALLAGGLLHVVLDHGHHPRGGNAASAFGALSGLVLFLVLPLEAAPVLAGAGLATLELLLEASPALLIGFAGAGLLSLVPEERLSRLMTGRNVVTSALRGVIFGLPLPICSCGVVPLYRGLMQKGVPAAAAIAFLIATPELGVDALVISVPFLGIPLTITRLVAAVILAMVAGILAGLLTRSEPAPAPVPVEPPPDCCDDEPTAAAPGKLRRAARYGFVESVDDLGPWILAGILIAGLLTPLFDPAWSQKIPAGADVPLFAILAAPVYVCASAATPVASVFITKGISAGAVVAFLLTGPATNVTTFGAIRGRHGTSVTTAVLLGIVATTLALGFAINGLGVVDEAAAAATASDHHDHGPLHWAAAGLFGLVLLASFFRQGARGFLATLGLVHGAGAHGHDGHDGHDHGDEGAADACCGDDDVPAATEETAELIAGS